jgi:hypothetical protein
MAVLQSTVWRVRPGMAEGFLANVATAKKILGRLGAQRVRAVNQMVGTNAPCTVVVVESADWKAFGELQSKLETDSEWQGFLAKVILNNRNPDADLIGTGLSAEVPLG